jgi:bifunctional DNase/RNase
MLTQMKVRGLMFDPYHPNVYILILRSDEGGEVLPLWIDKSDAQAISLALEGIFTQRPLTHDLIKNILDALDANLISVVVSDLKEAVYHARIHLLYRDAEFSIDARPSDAISLALRAGVPIFAAEEVIQKKGFQELGQWLENLSPEDFGRYSV